MASITGLVFSVLITIEGYRSECSIALFSRYGVRRLYTSDADFRKVGFLDVRNPFA